MARLTKKVEQGRHEIDVAHCMRNHLRACLARQSNQPRDARGFFEHCFFSEEMMRAQAVAVVARVHHNRVLRYAVPFQTTKNCADTFIDQRDQTEVTLLDAAVFIGCSPEEQLNWQPLAI